MERIKVNIWFEIVEAEPELYVQQVEVSKVPNMLIKLWDQMKEYYDTTEQFLDRVYISPEEINTLEKLDEYEELVSR